MGWSISPARNRDTWRRAGSITCQDFQGTEAGDRAILPEWRPTFALPILLQQRPDDSHGDRREHRDGGRRLCKRSSQPPSQESVGANRLMRKLSSVRT